MSKSDYVFVAPSARPPELRQNVEMICPAAPIQKTRPGAEHLHMKNYTYHLVIVIYRKPDPSESVLQKLDPAQTMQVNSVTVRP